MVDIVFVSFDAKEKKKKNVTPFERQYKSMILIVVQ